MTFKSVITSRRRRVEHCLDGLPDHVCGGAPSYPPATSSARSGGHARNTVVASTTGSPRTGRRQVRACEHASIDNQGGSFCLKARRPHHHSTLKWLRGQASYPLHPAVPNGTRSKISGARSTILRMATQHRASTRSTPVSAPASRIFFDGANFSGLPQIRNIRCACLIRASKLRNFVPATPGACAQRQF